MIETPRRAGSVPRLAMFGAAAWVLASVQFFAAHLIVESVWSRPYSWAVNNVSDLGNLTCAPAATDGRHICSPLHALMNAAFVLEGVLVIAGTLMITALWRRSAVSWAGAILLIVGGVGWILVGLAPADVNDGVHAVAALLVAVGGNLGVILLGLWARTGTLRPVSAVALLFGTIGVAATALFMTETYLGLGMGGMERLWVLTIQVWTFVAGCCILVRCYRGGVEVTV